MGGHSCAERVVELGIVEAAAEPLGPLALHDSLDAFDLAWRALLGAGSLVSLTSFTVVGERTLPCTSKDTFKSALSTLADVLDRFQVPDSAIGDDLNEQDRQGSLNRLGSALRQRCPDDRETVADGIQTLQRVRRIRVAYQHSGAATELPERFAALGIEYPPPSWSDAWAAIVAHTVKAFRSLRGVIRRALDTP